MEFSIPRKRGKSASQLLQENIRDLTTVTPSEKFLLMIAGTYVNVISWSERASVDLLAEKTGYHTRTIKRLLTALLKKKLLSTDDRSGGKHRDEATTYTVCDALKPRIVDPDRGDRRSQEGESTITLTDKKSSKQKEEE